MSHTVTWSERASYTASRYLADDREGLAQVLDATDTLADTPRPAGSIPYGSEDLHRLHIGRYRVLHEIYPADETIVILHVGRVA